MPIQCKEKIRFRSRPIQGGTQRFAFCGRKPIEVSTFKRKDGVVVKTHTRRLK